MVLILGMQLYNVFYCASGAYFEQGVFFGEAFVEYL